MEHIININKYMYFNEDIGKFCLTSEALEILYKQKSIICSYSGANEWLHDFTLELMNLYTGSSPYNHSLCDCNKGRLGAFVVDYKGNQVKVGSGYSDEERVNFWNGRDKYIGRVITVKYKEISKDKKTGLESLQFPVYCGVRELGKEPSYE